MSEPVFVDSNVLVYARDSSEPDKQPLAHAWLEHLWRSGEGRLSVQVLQEYYAVVTAKLDPGLERATARADVRDLAAWKPLVVDGRILEAGWELQDIFDLSWWDSLIVAAAQTIPCRWLLTEDLQHGQVLGDLEVVDPFRVGPSEL